MSIHSSLDIGGGLVRHRNVLTRAERIERLKAEEKFDGQAGDPLGLPKVGNRLVIAGAKKKKGPADAEEK